MAPQRRATAEQNETDEASTTDMRAIRDHADLFRRSDGEVAALAGGGVNATTINRMLRGVTSPSARVLLGVVRGIALTEADVSVLLRRLADDNDTGVRRADDRFKTHAEAATWTKNALDSSQIKDAGDGVVAMRRLATSDLERADAFEQAAGIYKVLGRYEEAKANYEHADSLIPSGQRDRKLKIQGNIANLLVHMGHSRWGYLLAADIASSSDAKASRRGWAEMTMGDASDPSVAAKHYESALAHFEASRREENAEKAEGNVRWSRVHLAYAQASSAGASKARERALNELIEAEQKYRVRDPEVALTAAFFHARCTNDRRKLTQVQTQAERAKLGEVAAKVAKALGVLLIAMVVFAGIFQPYDRQDTHHDPGLCSSGGVRYAPRLDPQGHHGGVRRHDTVG